MKKTGGYKGMLRDRCPKIVNYALKWQKAKDAWVNHAYRYFIKIVGDEKNINNNIIKSASENKKAVARIILGIKKGKTTEFDFHKSIDWDNLTDEEFNYWNRIESWVDWFRSNYVYIQNTWEISRGLGKDNFDIKVEIINTYLTSFLPEETDEAEYKEAKYRYVDNLVNFLMKCFTEEYV